MTTEERWILEYACRHKIHQVLHAFTRRYPEGLGMFKVAPVYQGLAALLFIVAEWDLEDFQGAIEILKAIYIFAEEIIPYRLYTRLLSGLKTMHLFHLLKNKDEDVLAKLNEYFPRYGTNAKRRLQKKELQFRKLVISLVADREKCTEYFNHGYKEDFGADFRNSMQKLINDFISKIEEVLPPTTIDVILSGGMPSEKDLSTPTTDNMEIILDLILSKEQPSAEDFLAVLDEIWQTGPEFQRKRKVIASGTEAGAEKLRRYEVDVQEKVTCRRQSDCEMLKEQSNEDNQEISQTTASNVNHKQVSTNKKQNIKNGSTKSFINSKNLFNKNSAQRNSNCSKALFGLESNGEKQTEHRYPCINRCQSKVVEDPHSHGDYVESDEAQESLSESQSQSLLALAPSVECREVIVISTSEETPHSQEGTLSKQVLQEEAYSPNSVECSHVEGQQVTKDILAVHSSEEDNESSKTSESTGNSEGQQLSLVAESDLEDDDQDDVDDAASDAVVTSSPMSLTQFDTIIDSVHATPQIISKKRSLLPRLEKHLRPDNMKLCVVKLHSNKALDRHISGIDDASLFS